MNAFEAVIGLEVHAQLLTKSKIFCTAANAFGEDPNTQVGIVSAGLPGSLPVINKHAVELAVRAGLALDCRIRRRSIFSRKNYFYPDLPKGYQISQFDEPICEDGHLEIELPGKAKKRVRIQRIHMEEDAGKSSHSLSGTLVNLNRAGVPLVEIVTHPDLRSPLEAGAYLRRLHGILVHAGICDGNLEQGNFRCDANVSVKPLGQKELGTRTELKNINSFKFIEKAIEYEIARQIAVIEGGGKIILETRGWDSAASKTFSMRTKEEAHDYRYFPDPDVPPLVLEESFIERIRKEMPELPDAKRARFTTELGLTAQDVDVFLEHPELQGFLEEVIRRGVPGKTAANWILSELLREIKKGQGESNSQAMAIPLSAERFAELLLMIGAGTISGKIAKTVFEEMLTSPMGAQEIVKLKGLVQVQDAGQIDAWVDEVMAANPSQVADLKAGKEKLMEYLVGQVMKLSRGKANPPIVNETIKRKLAQ